MNPTQLLRKLLTDVKVELADEFDRNFTRKAFFGAPWKRERANPNAKGSVLAVSGNLRRSLMAEVRGDSVVFSSSLPYASLHNEGGAIAVTGKMKKFFWAKHRGASDAGQSAEAELWKRMALMKAGSKISIPQRRFVGDAPEVKQAVQRVVGGWLKRDVDFLETLKGKK
jgi:phage gpG-like protein